MLSSKLIEMKSSLFLVATSALLASAGPLGRRAEVTDWVTEIVTVTVTDDGTSSATGGVFIQIPKHTPAVIPPPAQVLTSIVKIQSTTQAPAPPPPPPSSKPEVKVSTKAQPPPKETSTTPPPPPSNNLGDYESTILEKHNLHRKNHSASALEWDDTLAQYAANTANGCVFEHDMKQGGGGYGQNLASQGSSGNIDNLKVKSAAQGVTDMWYNGEAGNYNSFYGMSNPPSNVPLGDFGHFTQLVWKSSKKVGCATVKCPGGSVLSLPAWYTVCNYQPPGNYGGQYGANVLKPLGMSISVV
ncbi:hypothetical protein QQS21_008349 [Conoideocrella luteorostrata]|uniref:SCP domain-containing protein n=1 Tax=Conoideocrella luteorostrata TaxID=1105319 RepID=A0AAJ0CJW9_9HYPO|nr:hypothetical protein QQS21_008349 [Conoideocrella luteorostrata]